MKRDMASVLLFLVLLSAAGVLVTCGPPATPDIAAPITHLAFTGPLISARTTMVTAWEFPMNPLTDPSLDDSRLSNDIRWGFKLFTNTHVEAPQFVPGKVSCSNCHLNGGQRDRALPIVGIAGLFPEYNRRSGRLYTLNDRVLDCFMRSQNSTGHIVNGDVSVLPTATSKEVNALVAYITWLGKGYPMGRVPEWRGKNAIPADKQIPLDQLDPARGEKLFMEKCINCHGMDGQGVAIGDKKPAPLWGPDSWNDGAGAARVYTLAGIIRYMMPYTYPGSLTDEEAQLLARFITSKPRPSYPYKDQDYRADNKVPVDSVYYPKR